MIFTPKYKLDFWETHDGGTPLSGEGTVTLPSRPYDATAEDIADVQWQLSQVAMDPNTVIVWGHTIDFSLIPAAASAPAIPISRPRHHMGFGPKRIIARHVAGGHKPTLWPMPSPIPAPSAQPRRRSFEGVVHGIMEVIE